MLTNTRESQASNGEDCGTHFRERERVGNEDCGRGARTLRRKSCIGEVCRNESRRQLCKRRGTSSPDQRSPLEPAATPTTDEEPPLLHSLIVADGAADRKRGCRKCNSRSRMKNRPAWAAESAGRLAKRSGCAPSRFARSGSAQTDTAPDRVARMSEFESHHSTLIHWSGLPACPSQKLNGGSGIPIVDSPAPEPPLLLLSPMASGGARACSISRTT